MNQDTYCAPDGGFLVVTKEWRADHPEAVLTGKWEQRPDTETYVSGADGVIKVPHGSADPEVPVYPLRKWPWPHPA